MSALRRGVEAMWWDVFPYGTTPHRTWTVNQWLRVREIYEITRQWSAVAECNRHLSEVRGLPMAGHVLTNVKEVAA